jgi:parallel beta-helix repeat protein
MVCSLGHSATYYFSSTTGDDLRSVQQAQNPRTPWKSIVKLNSIFRALLPGDNILFKNGDTFHGAIIMVKSGSIKAPISFGNYGSGEKPILTGLHEIKNWVSKGSNFYEAIIPEINTPLSTVIIDGKMRAMGRFPNEDNKNSGYFTIGSFEDGYIRSTQSLPLLNFSGGEIVIRKNNWIIDRHLIISNTDNIVNYDMPENGITPSLGFGFFIQNHPSTLDTHGEWYFDNTNKKLMIYYLGDPSSGDIRVATIPQVITVRNMASNILFENISIEGSNGNLISLNGSSNFTFKNCNLEYIGQNAINTSSSRNLIISNTTIKNSLNSGVFLGWNDLGFVIKNSTFENIFNFAGMGKNGEMQSQAIYMSETSSNTIIEANKFFNCGYNGINFSGNNVTIKNNLIDTFCFIKDDGAGIYTYTGAAKTLFTNRKIIGNIIINGIGAVSGTKSYGSKDLPYVEGIYLDTFVSGVEIDGNTIANIKSKGIFLNNAKNITITNNKIINTGYSIYFKSEALNDFSLNIIVKNNDLIATMKTQLHFYVTTKFDDISILGKFDNNFFSKPMHDSPSIFIHTPSVNRVVDLLFWKANFGLDLNSSKGPTENLLTLLPEKKLSNLDDSVFFEYNYSNSSLSISLIGTYRDLKGMKVIEKVEIPAYSSIVLLKTKNNF